MSTIEKAISIATEAHKGDVDKAGSPYILHPLRVMFQMETEEEMIAAVLHDVLEDTAITPDQLKEMGFSERVREALDSVTKRAGETYEDFVRRAASHPIGKKVKLADLRDNMDLSRLERITDKDLERLKKYHNALKILKSL
jgi:(p)ppGpp synthase/HD superfamily hydrolase